MDADTLYIFVNGIRCRPSDAAEWECRATDFVENNRLGYAEAYRYGCPAVLRWALQPIYVHNVAALLRRRSPYYPRIVAAGHSNGCDILCQVLRKNADLRVDELHLVAAATPSDFDTNGLNDAIGGGQVKRVHLYCSPVDRALEFAKLSGGVLSALGFGGDWVYGDLGREGPRNQTDYARARTVVTWERYGHSEWVNEHFADLIGAITGGGCDESQHG
jgi:hypothetical protein